MDNSKSKTDIGTAGIVICAFGKAQYLHMASHLAMSIKYHNPELKIHLIYDDVIKYIAASYKQFFNGFSKISKEDLYPKGEMDPGYFKCSLYKYLPFDRNLYLDADALCLHDPAYLLDTEEDFAPIRIGIGKKDDKINYSIWATNKDLWEYFGLDNEQECQAVQSSALFIRKSKKTEKLYKLMQEMFYFPTDKLVHRWGSSVPDELIISGCTAKLKMFGKFEGSPVFFGSKLSNKSLSDLQKQHAFLALYGNGGPAALVRLRYREWYDRLMTMYSKRMGVRYIARVFQLLRGKFVNK